jgi:hypothetical protein
MLSSPGRRGPAAIALAAAIAASGSVIFDVVNPRILATSAMELALEAARGGDARPPLAVLSGKDKRERDWLHVERIARYAAAPPLDVVRFAGIDDLAAPPAGSAQVLLWSPGIDEDAGVSRAVCEAMPSAKLYELRSASGLSRLYAAARDASVWRPPLPVTRWSVRACGSPTARTTDLP